MVVCSRRIAMKYSDRAPQLVGAEFVPGKVPVTPQSARPRHIGQAAAGVATGSGGIKAMDAMTTVEVQANGPAQNFDLSKRFYQDFGFDLVWTTRPWHTSGTGAPAAAAPAFCCRIAAAWSAPTTS
jgi:hypothetical protein